MMCKIAWDIYEWESRRQGGILMASGLYDRLQDMLSGGPEEQARRQAGSKVAL
jgi:hypothetical protein